MRGFGRSTYKMQINSLEMLSDDLFLFIDSLKLEKFILMGWSTGGSVSMNFVIKYPKFVEKLILLSSVYAGGHIIYKKNKTTNLREKMTNEELISRMEKLVLPFFKKELKGTYATLDFLKAGIFNK